MKRRAACYGAVMLAVGVILFGGASLFHPPTVSPWDPTEALAEAARPLWLVDHTVLLIGILLLHLGLFIMHTCVTASRHPRLSNAAFACGVASFTLWVALFVFELTGWRLIAHGVAGWFGAAANMPIGPETGTGPEGLLSLVAQSVWATTISLGYAAAFILAIAVLLWSTDMALGGAWPRWVARLGGLVGWVSFVALPIAFGLPHLALWLLVPVAGLMGAWLLAAAWAMWHWRDGDCS